MDESSRKIEILKPFNAALDLTKLILFRPFDLGKWCVIGFAAFLAHLAGGGFSFHYNQKMNGSGTAKWDFRSFSHDVFGSNGAMPGWVMPALVAGGILVVVLAVVMLWLGSRGKFIFTDCVVRNRGAIVEPWREFRKEGNSLFAFSLSVGLGMIVLLALASIPFWLPLIFHPENARGPGFIAALVVFGIVAACVMVIWAITLMFMVPVMYRRRCSAVEGFRGALALVRAEPRAVVLYVLFVIVLWIAFAMVACVAACLTCCIVAIPYVGTVILLPAYVLFLSFLLLFLRQFGPEYDVWVNLPPPQPPPLPPGETLPPPLPPQT